jgi:PAS domain S-box-containing protein
MTLEKTLAQLPVDQDYRDILAALDAHAIVSVTNEAGFILYVNERFCNVSGYDRDELVGRNHNLVNSGLHSRGFFRQMWTTIRSGQRWHGVICNRRKDGGLYWVDSTIAPVLDDRGIPVRYISIRTDITRIKENEERLRRSQAFANIGTWDWDIVTGELVWSERISPLFGYPEGELATSYDNFLHAIHPDDVQHVVDAINACINDGADYDIEHRCVWPDGTVRWLHEKGDVIRDPDGVPLQMLGVVRDITVHKEAEKVEAAARVAAEKASQAKSQFLSAMSHELRTPLNAILGFAQLLALDADGLDPDQRDSIEEIRHAGRHLLELINEVLDLAKVEAGRSELAIKPLKLRELMDECCGLLGPLAKPKQLQVSCPIIDNGVRVRADYLRLKQVLLNLMSNAVKYTRPGGRIELRQLLLSEGQVRIEVEDSGIGIAADDLPSLFQPFNRLANDENEEEGTGIGLSIAKQLTEAMGGRIGVRSELGQGSCFWIELPVSTGTDDSNAPQGRQASVTTAGAPQQDRKRILYVEDNPANMRLMVNLLGRHPGIQLLGAATPEAALELAPGFNPDLLLLDMHLPGSSGIELLGMLRDMDNLAEVPAIAVSADAMTDNRQRALASGFAAYLTKPIDVEQLFGQLERYLFANMAQNV